MTRTRGARRPMPGRRHPAGRRPRPLTARPAALAACASLVLAGMLAGCTSARNTLGTHDSLCFRVLPAARRAVGTHPSFSGVRYLPAGQLVGAVHRARRQGVKVPEALADVARLPTCLVSYKGRFVLASVSKGWAPLPGPYLYAVVVIQQQTDTVVGTVLFHSVPLRFEHVFGFPH